MNKLDKIAYFVFGLLTVASGAFLFGSQPDYALGLLILMVFLIGIYSIKTRQYLGSLRSRALENLNNSKALLDSNIELHRKFDSTSQQLRNQAVATSAEVDRTRQQISAAQNSNIKKTLSSVDALRASTANIVEKLHLLGDPDKALTKVIWEDTQQTEAYLQLLPRITPRWAMPPLGRWALDAKSMLHLALLIEEHQPQVIVEVGSGASTVWLSYFVEQYGGKVYSFDHLAKYHEQTQQYLKKHDLEATATVALAPLTSYTIDGQEYSWYDMHAFDQFESINMLIIDGPPGSTGPWARYPAIPLLQPKLASDALVLLDDSDRQDEVAALKQWTQDIPSIKQIDHGISRLSVLFGFDQK